MSVMFRRPQFPGIFLKRLAVLLVLAGVSPADSLANELLELRTYRAQEPLWSKRECSIWSEMTSPLPERRLNMSLRLKPKFPGKYGLYFLLAECAREMGDPARVVSYLGRSFIIRLSREYRVLGACGGPPGSWPGGKSPGGTFLDQAGLSPIP